MLEDDIKWMDVIIEEAFSPVSTTMASWNRIKKVLKGNPKNSAELANIHAFILDGGLNSISERDVELRDLLEKLHANS